MENFTICTECNSEISENDGMISRTTCPKCRDALLQEMSDYIKGVSNASVQGMQSQQKHYRLRTQRTR